MTFTHGVFLKPPYSRGFGTLRLRGHDSRTGGHSPHEFVLAAGPGIPAGAQSISHSLHDFAPTVLEAAGAAAPADLDGRPPKLQHAAIAI